MTNPDVAILIGEYLGIFAIGYCAGLLILSFKRGLS